MKDNSHAGIEIRNVLSRQDKEYLHFKSWEGNFLFR